jgi:hypothetical protein
MPTLAFHAKTGSAEVFIDDEARVEIVAGKLSAGGATLARHADGAWHIGCQPLERITCSGPVRLDIEIDGSLQSFGTLAELWLVGNTAMAPAGPLARFDPDGQTWRAATEPRRPAAPQGALLPA